MVSEDQLRRIYHGAFGLDRLQVDVEVVEPTDRFGGGLRASGLVRMPITNVQVGDFHRIAHVDAAGRSAVYNDGLEIRSELQQRGFATDFRNHTRVLLQEAGVQVIRVTAGRDGGGRAWARMYDFDVDRIDGFGAADSPGGQSRGVGPGGEDVVISAPGSEESRRRALVLALFGAALADERISKSEHDELCADVERLLTPAAIASLADDLGADVLRTARWPGVDVVAP